MKTLIKTLTVTDGQMNVIKAGRRISLLQFSGNIEIFETQTAVNILGKLSKGIKKIYASFMPCLFNEKSECVRLVRSKIRLRKHWIRGNIEEA